MAAGSITETGGHIKQDPAFRARIHLSIKGIYSKYIHNTPQSIYKCPRHNPQPLRPIRTRRMLAKINVRPYFINCNCNILLRNLVVIVSSSCTTPPVPATYSAPSSMFLFLHVRATACISVSASACVPLYTTQFRSNRRYGSVSTHVLTYSFVGELLAACF